MTAAHLRHPGIKRGLPLVAGRDLALGVLLAALALWLMWTCLTLAFARQLSQTSPAEALRWRPDANALAVLAQQRLERAAGPADLAAASDLARRSLREGPVGTAPLRVLGLIAQRRGDMNGARALMTAAGERSHRDILTQAWLIADGLQRGDYEAAFDRADALLRLQAGLDRVVLPALVAAARDPRAAAILVRRLTAHGAEWRGEFLEALAAKGDPGAAFRILEALKSTAEPPTDQEAGFLVDRLVQAGDYQRAFVTWASLLPPSGVAHLTDLYDGDFAGLPGAAPFNWVLSPAGGVTAELAPPPSGPPVHALHVQFHPSAPADLAAELMLLAPGAYRLTGQALFDTPTDEGQFRWQVICADDGAVLADIGLGGGELGGWRPFAATFSAPPSGCAAQWLRLTGRAGESFDQVSAWFAGLKLTPLGAGRGGEAG